MKRTYAIPLVLGLMLFFTAAAAAPVKAQEVPRITPDELRAQLDDPRVIVLDVRAKHDWDRSRTKVVNARREDPRRFDWARNYSKDDILVLYCT